MGQLIDALLSFSRLGRKDPVKALIDMTGLAASGVAELRPGRGGKSANDRAAVHVRSLAGAPGDGTLVRQVLANLVSNAFKFSSSRSDPRIEIGGREEGAEILYWVKDNGTGFDMQYADRLFRVFSRLHRVEEFEGTGVGLALVQRIVQRHGGRVWGEGRPNEGATFFFTLPKT